MAMKIDQGYDHNYRNRVTADIQEKKENIQKEQEPEIRPEVIPTPIDEYISSEQSSQRPSGLYRVTQDATGNQKVIFEDPNQSPKELAMSQKETTSEAPFEDDATSATSSESSAYTVNTDKVDREIKQLKEAKKQLEKELRSVIDDEEKTKAIKKKIELIDNELRLKDTDTYRHQHAETIS